MADSSDMTSAAPAEAAAVAAAEAAALDAATLKESLLRYLFLSLDKAMFELYTVRAECSSAGCSSGVALRAHFSAPRRHRRRLASPLATRHSPRLAAGPRVRVEHGLHGGGAARAADGCQRL